MNTLLKQKHSLITIIFLCIFSWALIYISWFLAFVSFCVSLLLYGFIIYIFYRLWKKITHSQPLPMSEYYMLFLYRSSISLCLLILIIWWFTFYQNHISPATIPLYTLSNWEKTIRFQTMSHIASPDFYLEVTKNIQEAKKEGFVLFYEWVQPGSPESSEIFNKALGINFSEGLYENFSKLYGITAQNNNDFLSIENNKDYNIDLSLDEVVRIYQEKTASSEKKPPSILASEEVLDINADAITLLSELSDKQLMLVRYLNQSFMNFMLKHEWLRNTIIENVWNTDIFSVILDDRNEHLVDEILSGSENNIFIIYGLMHFSWVYELLKSQDSNWSIISEEYMQIIVQNGQKDNL